jgi:hypothetical protein
MGNGIKMEERRRMFFEGVWKREHRLPCHKS